MTNENKTLIKNLSIYGAIFAIVFGTVLHFFYQWSGNNIIVGLFAPVNESVWEHMKLIFTPFVLFAFIEFFFLRSKVKNYCFALIKEIGFAIFFIFAVFYTYTYFSGESILAIDISLFVISIVIAKWLGYKILIGMFQKWEFRGINTISIILLIMLTGFFVFATFNPPRTSLFKDPVTNTCGINQKL